MTNDSGMAQKSPWSEWCLRPEVKPSAHETGFGDLLFLYGLLSIFLLSYVRDACAVLASLRLWFCCAIPRSFVTFVTTVLLNGLFTRDMTLDITIKNIDLLS